MLDEEPVKVTPVAITSGSSLATLIMTVAGAMRSSSSVILLIVLLMLYQLAMDGRVLFELSFGLTSPTVEAAPSGTQMVNGVQGFPDVPCQTPSGG
jgi:hypothetical protein